MGSVVAILNPQTLDPITNPGSPNASRNPNQEDGDSKINPPASNQDPQILNPNSDQEGGDSKINPRPSSGYAQNSNREDGASKIDPSPSSQHSRNPNPNPNQNQEGGDSKTSPPPSNQDPHNPNPNQEGEDEGEGEGECGFCLFMKGGGCRDEFIEWEKMCLENKEKSGEDEVTEKCLEATFLLKKCMEAHADYYGPILSAEKDAEVKEAMAEAESSS